MEVEEEEVMHGKAPVHGEKAPRAGGEEVGPVGWCWMKRRERRQRRAELSVSGWSFTDARTDVPPPAAGPGMPPPSSRPARECTPVRFHSSVCVCESGCECRRVAKSMEMRDDWR